MLDSIPTPRHPEAVGDGPGDGDAGVGDGADVGDGVGVTKGLTVGSGLSEADGDEVAAGDGCGPVADDAHPGSGAGWTTGGGAAGVPGGSCWLKLT
jgi:hypothetical protein